MKNYKKISVKFLHSKINFFLDKGVNLDFVFSFFKSHFEVRENYGFKEPLVDIYVTKDTFDNNEVDYEDGKDVWIRKSASEFFTSPAKSLTVGNIVYIKATKSNTVFVLNNESKDINVYLSDKGFELEIIELIRDIVLKHEENKEVMVLHATCAYKDGKATIISGTKGAGKSTILLELVNKLGYQFMSGDKTFLVWEDGEVFASGWPDYPHLGVGTLSKYPKLVDALNLSDRVTTQKGLWYSNEKVAIDPIQFNKIMPMVSVGVLCPVDKILYPYLADDGDCQVIEYENHIADLKKNIESSYEPGKSHWNNFIIKSNQAGNQNKVIIDKLNNIPAFKISGNGYLNGCIAGDKL